MGKDYYKILGVEKGAIETELKKGGPHLPAACIISKVQEISRKILIEVFSCSLQKTGHEVPPGEHSSALRPVLAVSSAFAAVSLLVGLI